MILLTGANGQTGRAVIKELLSKDAEVRIFVHKAEQAHELKSLGISQVVVGDMLNQEDVNKAFENIATVYHICPAVSPYEEEIGRIAINAGVYAKIRHFVYHSVLHSRLQDMPHHKKKLMVEEMLVDSGLPFTIIQPTVYMQNLLASWKLLAEKGIFEQRFFSSKDTRMCMVDLEDFAEAVSIILTKPGHVGATYEICGPDNLSLDDILGYFSQAFEREIKAETEPIEPWAVKLKKAGIGSYQIETLSKMFQHYCEHGFMGNPNALTWLLGRRPRDFASFIHQTKLRYEAK